MAKRHLAELRTEIRKAIVIVGERDDSITLEAIVEALRLNAKPQIEGAKDDLREIGLRRTVSRVSKLSADNLLDDSSGLFREGLPRTPMTIKIPGRHGFSTKLATKCSIAELERVAIHMAKRNSGDRNKELLEFIAKAKRSGAKASTLVTDAIALIDDREKVE